jgi:hypothetical protein
VHFCILFIFDVTRPFVGVFVLFQQNLCHSVINLCVVLICTTVCYIGTVGYWKVCPAFLKLTSTSQISEDESIEYWWQKAFFIIV